MLPRWQVHIAQVDLNLAARAVVVAASVIIQVGQQIVIKIGVLKIRRMVGEFGGLARLLEGGNLGQCLLVVALQALQRQAERRDGAFQPFQQVDSHQRLQAFLAVGLL